jgi:glycosyltransferase involved in cell wall biosynthesis
MSTSDRRGPEGDGLRLRGVIVTYRRPEDLRVTLTKIDDQTRPLDDLLVVDNAADAETESIVRTVGGHPDPEYLPMEENLGFAGGVGAGMDRMLVDASDEDWMVVFDDDDPPPFPTVLQELERFAIEMLRRDTRTAAVGIHGARFDWRRGRIVRVADHELRGAVAVDYVGGNSVPLFRAGAVRDVGPFSHAIFFGLSEVEHGLRLRAAGYSIYAHGDLWRRERSMVGRMGVSGRPSIRLSAVNWRQYYGLRNLIHILRQHGRTATALRVTLVTGLGKPLANLPLSPGRAVRLLRLNWRATRDGWTGRMGRTVEPHPWGRRAEKAPKWWEASAS